MSNLLLKHTKLIHLPETNDCPDIRWFNIQSLLFKQRSCFARRHPLPALLVLRTVYFIFVLSTTKSVLPWIASGVVSEQEVHFHF